MARRVIKSPGDAYVQALRYNRPVSPVSFYHGQGTATFIAGRWVQTSELKAA